MKVLLYSEGLDKISKSGLGRAIRLQQTALEEAGIEYTLDPNDHFDLLHINTYFPESFFFASKCRKEGKAVVYHAHSTKEDFENSFHFSNQLAPAFKQWLKLCYRVGDILVTPTPYSKKLLESYEMGREIEVISNGIELDRFQPIPDARKQFMEHYGARFGFSDQDYVVIGIGLYLERKGILDFVELARRMPDMQFVWFGYSNLNLVPSEIREAVETQLPNLHFAGYVENQEIILALQGANVFLFPTLEETEGIPAIEACAARADFVVRDIPVFEGWLKDGVNTYMAKDLEGFEARLRGLQDGSLPSLTDAAFSVAQERDLHRIGERLRIVYERAMELASERVYEEEREAEDSWIRRVFREFKESSSEKSGEAFFSALFRSIDWKKYTKESMKHRAHLEKKHLKSTISRKKAKYFDHSHEKEGEQ